MKKKRLVVILLCIAVFLGVCKSDNWQQDRLYTVKTGYEFMEEQQYASAAECFEKYLDEESNVYWWLIDHFNKTYSREKVQRDLEKCYHEQ